jgi:hypothetical protein
MDAELPPNELAQQAISRLKARLPANWEAGLQETPDLRATIGTPTTGQHLLLIEVKPRFRPADIDNLNKNLGRRLRATPGTYPILVISDYFSPRTRRALTEEGFNYVDTTGNVRIALDGPSLFLELEGANHLSTPTPNATLKGATAGRLMRFLVDVRPPYRLSDLEAVTGINKGYLSRLLEALTSEGLITRPSRGPVTDVDWPEILRRRASQVDLYRTNNAFTFIARTSIEGVLKDLRTLPLADDLVLTGSVAASRLAPIAAPSSLALYGNLQSDVVREGLELLPAEEGANVVLLRPPNTLPYLLTESIGGLTYAAPSQIVIDCLSGTGRMPAEGDAVLEWMSSTEDIWRCRDIDDFTSRTSERGMRG